MNNQLIALDYAKAHGFNSVDFQEKWNDYDVFIANIDTNEIAIIGYPFFILVKDGVARENNISELMSLMHLSEVGSNFLESLE